MGSSKLHEVFVDDVALKFIDDVARDSVVGVDASSLHHKYLQPVKAEIRAQRYDRAVGEFIDRVQRLTKCGVAVHVVFDWTTPCVALSLLHRARGKRLRAGRKQDRAFARQVFNEQS